MFKKSLLVSALFFATALDAGAVTWNQVPESEAVLIRDPRWHQLSSKEKEIMLHVVNNQTDLAVQSLKDNAAAYNNLTSLYDLLGLAIRNYQTTLVFFLFSQGIYLTDETIKLLCDHSSYGSQNLLTMAFDFGLSSNYCFANGDNLLQYVIKNKQRDIVFVLLKVGADISAIDSNGDSLLHLAVKNKQWYITSLLIKAGVDTSILDSNGKMAFDYVSREDMGWEFHDCLSSYYDQLSMTQKMHLMTIVNNRDIETLFGFGCIGLCIYLAYNCNSSKL